MAGKARPSLRSKTLYNVEHSNLCTTDKKCIAEVFARLSQLEEIIAKKEDIIRHLCEDDA